MQRIYQVTITHTENTHMNKAMKGTAKQIKNWIPGPAFNLLMESSEKRDDVSVNFDITSGEANYNLQTIN